MFTVAVGAAVQGAAGRLGRARGGIAAGSGRRSSRRRSPAPNWAWPADWSRWARSRSGTRSRTWPRGPPAIPVRGWWSCELRQSLHASATGLLESWDHRRTGDRIVAARGHAGVPRLGTARLPARARARAHHRVVGGVRARRAGGAAHPASRGRAAGSSWAGTARSPTRRWSAPRCGRPSEESGIADLMVEPGLLRRPGASDHLLAGAADPAPGPAVPGSRAGGGDTGAQRRVDGSALVAGRRPARRRRRPRWRRRVSERCGLRTAFRR